MRATESGAAALVFRNQLKCVFRAQRVAKWIQVLQRAPKREAEETMNPLLPDTKRRKDFPEQFIRVHLPGNFAQRLGRAPQFLGGKFARGG